MAEGEDKRANGKASQRGSAPWLGAAVQRMGGALMTGTALVSL